jgi:dihydrofolate reductase
VKAIMAMSENRCIGLNGKLPFHSSGDFKWFKEFTMGKTLIVGRKTFDTIPLLLGRNCLVLSKADKNVYFSIGCNINGMDCKFVPEYYIMGMIGYGSDSSDLIIAGGKSIYELFMPHITEFYVTILDITVSGDTFMPEFEHLFSKNEVIREFEGGKVIKYYDRITGSHTIVGTPPPRCKICDAEIYNEPEEGFNYCSDCGCEVEV